MHLPTLTLTLLPFAAASSLLTKRCSPIRDPDLPHGYLPPAPCWQTFDTACQPYLLSDTEMTLDAKHSLAVVYGLSASCKAEIAEELARAADGRKNYGWRAKHGVLTVIENEGGKRILVISGMSEDAVARYGKLTYQT